ncbi:MAG: LCP family protein [Defluviitaleaceae bacterium]|nr:LCP family protein [Defluviitaleaceae bacterium]
MSFYSKNKKKVNLFIKAFLITLVSSSAVVVAVLAVVLFRNIQQPPEIPQMPLADVGLNFPSQSGEEDEDLAINSGMIAPERFTQDDRRDLFFTFLIIGLNEGTNANTVMVASYDWANQEAHLVSIPRDSLINTNRNIRKLSGGYINGALHGRGVAGGVAQMQREVMSVIGFVPDFYVVINYNAFYQIIDSVGGIMVDVPIRMRYDDPLQNLHIDIHPGLQSMDGRTALHFARYRNSNPGFQAITDYQRIENQQIIVNAVLENLLRPANILRIPEFIDIFNENVYTNLTTINMLQFANQLNEIRGTDSLTSHTVPTLGTSGYPMWYEILDAEGIVELVNRTINPYEKDIELGDLDIIVR